LFSLVHFFENFENLFKNSKKKNIGRPMRIAQNEYAKIWETERRQKMDKLLSRGVVPSTYDQQCRETGEFEEDDLKSIMKFSDKPQSFFFPHLLGQVSGSIHEIKPAKEIIDEMVNDAVQIFKTGVKFHSSL